MLPIEVQKGMLIVMIQENIARLADFRNEPVSILSQWFLKCGSWTRSMCNTWELVRNADAQVPSQTY